MSEGEDFDWALARNLAYRLRNGLDRFAKLEERRNKKYIRLDGDIALGDKQFSTQKKARCTFDVGPDWVDKIPIVRCHETWLIRKPPEWHAAKDGTLCIEFDLNWKQELVALVEQYTYGLTAEYAANWILNSTRSLLNRHLFATRQGITSWSKHWDYWPHGTAASKIYSRTHHGKGCTKC